MGVIYFGFFRVPKELYKVPSYLLISKGVGNFIDKVMGTFLTPNRFDMPFGKKTMIEKEYYTVQEVSKKMETCSRNIRKTINKIKNTVGSELLYKDVNNRWKIHHLIIPKFKRKNKRKPKYYALSMDPVNNYTVKEIESIIEFVCEQMKETSIEINYVIEPKIANGRHHLHCYVNCGKKRKLIEQFQLGFSQLSYQQNEIYDLERWKNYMIKDGEKIKCVKK